MQCVSQATYDTALPAWTVCKFEHTNKTTCSMYEHRDYVIASRQTNNQANMYFETDKPGDRQLFAACNAYQTLQQERALMKAEMSEQLTE